MKAMHHKLAGLKFMANKKAMRHQLASLKFMVNKKAIFDASDPGTGKTFVQIADFVRQHKRDGKAALVLCPKSLMRAAWAADIKRFAPHLRVSLCYAENRTVALEAQADVYIINIDGVKTLAKKNKAFFKKFGRLIIDESSSIKHRTSDRSKAVAAIAQHFEWRRCLSGTPSSNGICNLWHQYFVLDGGQRLGKSFFAFRNAVCTPKQSGKKATYMQWTDKPGIELVVAELLKDITIRHKFEDCVDIPENHKYAISFQINEKHQEKYREMEIKSLLVLRKNTISAINAAVLVTKLLQVASGAVYNDEGEYSLIDSERYEMVLDLVEARTHSIVFYQWEHQLTELVKEAKARKISYAVWDSNHPEIANEFQDGAYQVLFAHPASAGHGLTLTRGTATIWPSPTYNLEHYLQGLKRIHRIGQTEKTETIVVLAEGTVDERVWAALEAKNINMTALLKELAA